MISDLTALGERIKLLQEEIAAKLNEQNNRILFTLTMVTVLALPINIVAGFFGMNVGGFPSPTILKASGSCSCWSPASPSLPAAGPSASVATIERGQRRWTVVRLTDHRQPDLP